MNFLSLQIKVVHTHTKLKVLFCYTNSVIHAHKMETAHDQNFHGCLWFQFLTRKFLQLHNNVTLYMHHSDFLCKQLIKCTSLHEYQKLAMCKLYKITIKNLIKIASYIYVYACIYTYQVTSYVRT